MTPIMSKSDGVIVYTSPERQRPRMLVMEVQVPGFKSARAAFKFGQGVEKNSVAGKYYGQIAQEFVAQTKDIVVDDTDVTLLSLCLDTRPKDGPTVTVTVSCEFKSLATSGQADWHSGCQ